MIRLPFSETLRLQNIQITSIGIYYLFNFIDRDISNVFLLVALACCVLDYKGLYKNIKKQRALVISVFLFSIWVTVVGIYHNSPMHELDNYYRFLLLLPLLIISVKDYQLILILNICALGALGHLFWTYTSSDIVRFTGTSSNAITYANLCALFSIMCIYFYFIKKNNSILLLLSSGIFLLILVLTQTRGPLIGIMISFIYLAFLTRSKLLVSIISIIVLSIVLIPNPVIDRIKIISQIDLEINNSVDNYKPIYGSGSINQRIFYLQYGFEKLKNHSLVGLGPNHLYEKMLSYTEKNKINIKARDHLHNEFLDISVKFGIFALILLLLIYFSLYRLPDKANKVMINLILIMLISSQFTQSHFAHHQAITFFITLAYLSANLKNKKF